MCLEVNDLNFELVFPECMRQDGSGEKGFLSIWIKTLSSKSKGNLPGLSLRSESASDTAQCPGK
jgi:hypothetical protein